MGGSPKASILGQVGNPKTANSGSVSVEGADGSDLRRHGAALRRTLKVGWSVEEITLQHPT